jgi:hypothetical protein
MPDGETYAIALEERNAAIQHTLFLNQAGEQSEVLLDAVGSNDSGRIHELFRMCV